MPVTRMCLDDVEALALVEHRLTQTARQLAFVHIDACLACLELVVELVRAGLDTRPQQPLETELELRLDER